MLCPQYPYRSITHEDWKFVTLVNSLIGDLCTVYVPPVLLHFISGTNPACGHYSVGHTSLFACQFTLACISAKQCWPLQDALQHLRLS